MVQLKDDQLKKEFVKIDFFFDPLRERIMSIAAIEREAQLPRNTLLNSLRIGRAMPQKHMANLVKVLMHFGYEPVYDWHEVMRDQAPEESV